MKLNKKKSIIQMAYVGLFMLLLSFSSAGKAEAEMELFSLKNIHQNIVEDYEGVKHISRQKLIDVLKSENKDDVLIFDVREKDEYAVSHLKDAKLLLPSTWKSSFLKKYGEQVKGKKIVFYCSVGVRSSKMAKYLGQSLLEQGAKEIYNLEEGIFGWANVGAPLYKSEPTKNESTISGRAEVAKLQKLPPVQSEVKKLNQNQNPTTKVHPYNSHWGQLISDENLRSYVP